MSVNHLASLAFCLGFCSVMSLEGAGVDASVHAITKPKADVLLSFTMPGRVAAVHVEEGALVKADQALVQIDNAVEKLSVEQLKAKAEETSQVEAARMQLEQKRVDLKKIEWAAERGSATTLELEHAKLDVKIGEFSLKIAQFEHQQNRRKYEEARLSLERMQLISPFEGRVEQIDVETGESVKALEPVLRVVKIDPLWIDAPVPIALAEGIKAGLAVDVSFPHQPGAVQKATVIFVSHVIDAGSDTRRVRLEMKNKEGRPAGEHVRLSFPR